MISDAEFLPPPAKQSKVKSSSCEIGELKDAELPEIFKHLPPLDRLISSEVCKRWYDLLKAPWRDVTHLDLSKIPGPCDAPIIKRCPNLRTVAARRSLFDAHELHVFARLSLACVKLYRSRVLIPVAGSIPDPLAAVFSSDFRAANWQELILQDVTLEFLPWLRNAYDGFPANFPTSLKRLQLRNVKLQNIGWLNLFENTPFMSGIEQLRQLECLILPDPLNGEVNPATPRLFALASLPNLRELFLARLLYDGRNLGRALMQLVNLKVLFIHNVPKNFDDFDQLATKHPCLRILAMSGGCGSEMEFPARVRYANGLNADPLPQLHVFVGKSASEKIRFPQFHSDAAKAYPITEPLPQFLGRADIKPIFDGVWIAEKIKEAAIEGVPLYDYEADVAIALRNIDV